MGCLSRVGCLVLGLLLGALALGCVLATRPVGPRYSNGVYTYDAAGRERTVTISAEAARRFDAKVSGELSQAERLEAVLRGVPITEEELNSRLAEELATRGLAERGARVDRLFIRLSSGGARGYVYTTVAGLRYVLHSDLDFRVENNRLTVAMSDVQAGRLPIDIVAPAILQAMSDRTGIEQTIALVIPEQVRDVRVEEGRLRIVLNLPPGTTTP